MQSISIVIYIVLALEILIAIAFLFFSNYIKKKANNLADKSDLEELTEIVESVKKSTPKKRKY